MEEVLLRFSHLGEGIFDLLDEKTLQKCRKVGRTWKCFIEDPNQKLLWIQIIKKHEKTIEDYRRNYNLKRFISSPQKWSKLRIQNLREFAKKLEKDLVNGEEMECAFLKKYAELGIKLNGKAANSAAALHCACFNGNTKIAQILLQKSVQLDINPNDKNNKYGYTAFHYACIFGKTGIVEMMLDNAESFNLDFTVKDQFGSTGYEYAKHNGNPVAELIKRKLPAGKF
jgi:hypothetical protein